MVFISPLSLTATSDAGFRINQLYHNSSNQGVVDAALIGCAHSLLDSLMLRRLKREVLSQELPPKIEKKIVVPLSDMQRFIYAGILKQDMEKLLELSKGGKDSCSPSSKKPGIHYSSLNSMLMQLRKVCNHPFLLPDLDPMVTDDRILEASSKLQVLDKILTKLQQEGRKALIYSQFTSMLDLIGDYMRYRNYKFLRLDGSTPAARRRYEIACFENPRSRFFVYLISTRAGGLGITLIAADTVIIFDSDWNPSADLQAMDRVHRIGQKKTVHCYRLVTQGTVEERIVLAAEQKALMNALVMRDDVGALPGRSPEHEPKASFSDVLLTIRHGLRCIGQATSAANMSQTSIEELLDKAETKVFNGSEDELAGIDPAAVAARKAEQENGSTADASMLEEMFQTLPAVRQFEGKHYSKRKSNDDLGSEWAVTLDSKRRSSKLEVTRVVGKVAELKKKKGFKHRRTCQRCKRATG
eukprot:703044-Hanusia_phi.AAC.1